MDHLTHTLFLNEISWSEILLLLVLDHVLYLTVCIVVMINKLGNYIFYLFFNVNICEGSSWPETGKKNQKIQKSQS